METLNRLPWAAQSAVFKKLADIADVGAMDRADRMKYDEALKKYRDSISVYQGARDEGIEQGMQQGQLKEKLSTARKMKAHGLSMEMISDITGLSVEEIRSI